MLPGAWLVKWLERWVPTEEKLRQSRWLAWLAPWLAHPSLWLWSRHGVALGAAIGIFFGLLVPVAQIPASAAVAVVLRANLPAAAASTLVSNPVTFAPVYYFAYRLGHTVLGTSGPVEAAQAASQLQQQIDANQETGFWQRIKLMGRPLLVGLLILAVVAGVLSYTLISILWALRQWWRQRRSP